MLPVTLLHFFCYGLLGWCAEILWTSTYSFYRSYKDPACPPEFRTERWRLTGRTYLWMLPIYGTAGLLFEPVHEALRLRALWQRGVFYVAACFLIEYSAGYALRRLTGRCPWDYHWARWHLHGLIRPDYTPVWLLMGFFFERTHDILLRAGPAVLGAM